MKRLQLFCHFRLVCSLKTFQRSYKEDCADCFSEEICKCLFLCLCVRSGIFFELPARQAATEMIHHLMGKKQTTHAGCVIETKQVFFLVNKFCFAVRVLDLDFHPKCWKPSFLFALLKALTRDFLVVPQQPEWVTLHGIIITCCCLQEIFCSIFNGSDFFSSFFKFWSNQRKILINLQTYWADWCKCFTLSAIWQHVSDNACPRM